MRWLVVTAYVGYALLAVGIHVVRRDHVPRGLRRGAVRGGRRGRGARARDRRRGCRLDARRRGAGRASSASPSRNHLDTRRVYPRSHGEPARHRALRCDRRPRPAQAAARACCGSGRPACSTTPGSSAPRWRTSTPRPSSRSRASSCDEFGHRAVTDDAWEPFSKMLTLRPAVRRAGGAGRRRCATPRSDLGADDREVNFLHYLSVPPKAALDVVRQLDEAAPGRAVPDHHGEAVRHRPRDREEAQRPAARGLRREPDLPDRPLPRQGGGAEHPGVPLRQRALRADLEPQLHRPRADRRAGDPRPRGPHQVLRVDRRLPRHGRHPPDAGARVHGDGAADLAGARADQRREEQGVPLDAAARAAQRGPRSVQRLPPAPRHRRRLRHRDVHRAQGRDRQLALGRRAVLPAHRQEARRGRPDHLDRVQGAAADDVPAPGPTPAPRVPTTSPSTSPTSRRCRCRSTASGPARA